MTPKRIKRRGKKTDGPMFQPTKPMKIVVKEESGRVPLPEVVPDAGQRINSASTKMFYKFLASINNDFPDEMNPGAYAMGITRFEMEDFLEKMKKQGKTYGEAADILERKVDNMPESGIFKD